MINVVKGRFYPVLVVSVASRNLMHLKGSSKVELRCVEGILPFI